MSHRIKQLTQTEISVFCQQIAMVVTSGLPTYYGISILRDEAADEETAALFDQIYQPMEKGSQMHPFLPDLSLSDVVHLQDLSHPQPEAQCDVHPQILFGFLVIHHK